MRRILLLALATVVLAAIPQTTGAAPRKKDPPCSVSVDPVTVGQTYVVLATGLPVGAPINLFVTEGGQTVGRPLGSTPDGTFALNEASGVAGTTTYEFTGPVRPNIRVYSSCSVQVSA